MTNYKNRTFSTNKTQQDLSKREGIKKNSPLSTKPGNQSVHCGYNKQANKQTTKKIISSIGDHWIAFHKTPTRRNKKNKNLSRMFCFVYV